MARRVGLVLEHFPFTKAACQLLYVNLVFRFHTRLGRFSPGTAVSSYTYKSESFHISGPYFLVARYVYKACLAAASLIICSCAAAVTQRRLENPVGWYVVCYKKNCKLLLLLLLSLLSSSLLLLLLWGRIMKWILFKRKCCKLNPFQEKEF